MTRQRTLGRLGMTMAGLIGLLGAVQSANATPPQAAFPTKALNYTTWLARAMDQCSPATVSVVQPGAPSSGCIQSNVTTDDDISPGAKMGSARLAVRKTGNKRGRISVFGKGFFGGQRMKARLTMRVTQLAVQKLHPPGPANITYQDFTVDCGNSPLTGCFTANLNGAVAGSMTLADCLAQNSMPPALNTGNIQILDAALVNCDTGKIIATPGIRE